MLGAFRALAATATSKKDGPDGSHGRRPAEIFFSAKFSLPKKKPPFPALIFEDSSKHVRLQALASSPYPIPVLAEPKKIIRALDQLRALKTFPSADAVNTTTGPQLPKLSTFPTPSALWTNPGNQATSAAPTEPSVATASNPLTRPRTSSWPRSSAINSSHGPLPSPSGRATRILTFESLEQSLLG